MQNALVSSTCKTTRCNMTLAVERDVKTTNKSKSKFCLGGSLGSVVIKKLGIKLIYNLFRKKFNKCIWQKRQ